MVQFLFFALMVVALIAVYLKWWWLHGLIIGIVFTYIFTTQGLFRRVMGREPTDKEDNEIFKALVGRSKR